MIDDIAAPAFGLRIHLQIFSGIASNEKKSHTVSQTNSLHISIPLLLSVGGEGYKTNKQTNKKHPEFLW